MLENIVVIGCNGAIGSAFVKRFATDRKGGNIYAFSRSPAKIKFPSVNDHVMDYGNEDSLAASAAIASESGPLDLVIVATGILHEQGIMPEKTLKDLSAEKFMKLFEANAVHPALAAKYFMPLLNRKRRSLFAAISARVGSISDNRLGGWYSYRASKSALNMIIKNASIEIGRSNKNAIIVGLHPGTVDSPLSKPFQGSVPPGKLFQPDFSVEKMIGVLERLTPEHSGKCFSHDGEEVPA